MAQKDIQSVLQEDRVFPPSSAFAKHATLKAAELQSLYDKAAGDYVGFWADLAVAEIDWKQPFTVPLDDSRAPNFRWFTDGQLNVSHNCLDVHLARRGDKVAVIFEGEPGDVRKLTYAQLHQDVCQFANALKAQGMGRGDRVIIYMPLIPEAIVSMQACARIGAVHSVVFGGFSANAVKDRIEDAGAKLVITADAGWRGGNASRTESCGRQGAVRGLRVRAAGHRLSTYRRRRATCAQAAMFGGTTQYRESPCLRAGMGRCRASVCSCCIPPDPPANPKEFSIAAAAICSTPS